MIGFPAQYQAVYQCSLGPSAAARLVADVFQNLGWKYGITDEGGFKGSVPVSGFSWGERVAVDIDQTGAIRIDSRCSWQIIDWGKNKANVKKFIAHLEQGEAYYRSLEQGAARQEFEIDGSSRIDKLFSGE